MVELTDLRLYINMWRRYSSQKITRSQLPGYSLTTDSQRPAKFRHKNFSFNHFSHKSIFKMYPIMPRRLRRRRLGRMLRRPRMLHGGSFWDDFVTGVVATASIATFGLPYLLWKSFENAPPIPKHNCYDNGEQVICY